MRDSPLARSVSVQCSSASISPDRRQATRLVVMPSGSNDAAERHLRTPSIAKRSRCSSLRAAIVASRQWICQALVASWAPSSRRTTRGDHGPSGQVTVFLSAVRAPLPLVGSHSVRRPGLALVAPLAEPVSFEAAAVGSTVSRAAMRFDEALADPRRVARG